MNESIDFLQEHCEFKDSHDCFVLLAVSRKKDSKEMTNSQEIVFREVLRKPEDIKRKYKRLVLNCKNYRGDDNKKYPFYVYITVNARNGKKASQLVLRKILDCFYEESKGQDRSRILNRIDREFISALMKKESRGSTRYFVIDIDTKDMDFINQKIDLAIPEDVKIISRIETRHGFHYKTTPFNIKEFNDNFTQKELSTLVAVHRDRLMFVEYINNG